MNLLDLVKGHQHHSHYIDSAVQCVWVLVMGHVLVQELLVGFIVSVLFCTGMEWWNGIITCCYGRVLHGMRCAFCEVLAIWSSFWDRMP